MATWKQHRHPGRFTTEHTAWQMAFPTPAQVLITGGEVAEVEGSALSSPSAYLQYPLCTYSDNADCILLMGNPAYCRDPRCKRTAPVAKGKPWIRPGSKAPRNRSSSLSSFQKDKKSPCLTHLTPSVQRKFPCMPLASQATRRARGLC